MLLRPLAIAIALIAGAGDGTASGGPTRAAHRTWRARDVVAAVRRTGQLIGPAVVDEDLDLSTLLPPRSVGAIYLEDVQFRGRLHGTPPAPLKIVGGSICSLSPGPGDRWPNVVDLRSVDVARLRFPRAQFANAFSCLECRVCRAVFNEARFEADATFIETTFGASPPDGICAVRIALSCDRPEFRANFSDGAFALAARFDRVRFVGGASFDGVQFAASARFPAVVAEHPLSFIGARIGGDAEFRGGRFAGLRFGLEEGRSYERSEFSARADFRDTTFTGSVHFDDTAFRGEATFRRARVEAEVVSFRGAVASKTVDLRGLQFAHACARLLLDPAGADAVLVDWGDQGDAIRRGFDAATPGRAAIASVARRDASPSAGGDPATTLRVLSAHLKESDQRAARQVAFEAQRWHRASAPCREGWVECRAGDLEWWLWMVPTHNGSDPGLPLTVLAVLWVVALVTALARGPVPLTPRARRARPPVWAPESCETAARRRSYASWLARAGEAVSLATALVLKVGSPGSRCVAPASRTALHALTVLLGATALLSWVALGALAAVIAAGFPGLAFLKLGG
jgi:hypothetical protein